MVVQYWEYPVDLRLGGIGNQRTITATCFACECLLTLWPREHGPAYRRALTICLDAMEGRVPQSAARRAFVDAAAEADILQVVQYH
ncbi:MAG: hypothetical protein JWL86_4894 [Rhizobium sp.]|nr:hypothetical protein [Rhizobium sp.]